jgi:uncharacterized protein YcgI (DUF1989 family)
MTTTRVPQPAPQRVPAGHAVAIVARAGQYVVITDIDGGQVGDLFAFSFADPAEHLSASHTRAALRRLFPAIGESFVTNRRRPILTLMEDTSPGVHDMLIAACDPERYRLLGVADGHRSCATNLVEALAPFGYEPPVTPQPVNVFMNTPAQVDGTITYGEAPSRAGDQLVLRAEIDAIVVLSACPMDIIAISRKGLGPLGIAATDALPQSASASEH